MSEVDQLRAFALEIMSECWPMGDVDGGFLQDTAEKHGLIAPEMRYAACCEEGCSCAEYATDKEWAEGVECYRYTTVLKPCSSDT